MDLNIHDVLCDFTVALSFQAIAVQVMFCTIVSRLELLTASKQVLCASEEITDCFSGLLLNNSLDIQEVHLSSHGSPSTGFQLPPKSQFKIL